MSIAWVLAAILIAGLIALLTRKPEPELSIQSDQFVKCADDCDLIDLGEGREVCLGRCSLG